MADGANASNLLKIGFLNDKVGSFTKNCLKKFKGIFSSLFVRNGLSVWWRIHTGGNRDQDRNRELMGYMLLCGSFNITPEPGQQWWIYIVKFWTRAPSRSNFLPFSCSFRRNLAHLGLAPPVWETLDPPLDRAETSCPPTPPPHCSGPGLCSCLGSRSIQYEYIIKVSVLCCFRSRRDWRRTKTPMT